LFSTSQAHHQFAPARGAHWSSCNRGRATGRLGRTPARTRTDHARLRARQRSRRSTSKLQTAIRTALARSVSSGSRMGASCGGSTSSFDRGRDGSNSRTCTASRGGTSRAHGSSPTCGPSSPGCAVASTSWRRTTPPLTKGFFGRVAHGRGLIFTRFRRHPRRRENAPGVVDDETEEKNVHARVQGGGSATLQGRGSDGGAGCHRSRSDGDRAT